MTRVISRLRSAIRATACAGLLAAAPAAGQSIVANLGATPRVVTAPLAKITVPLIIDLSGAGPTSIASLQAGLSWNPAVLTFDSLRVAAGVSWVVLANTAGAATGSVTFNAFDAVALPATATVANAFFTAGGAEAGTRVLLSPTAAGSATGQNVLPFVRPRSLDVCLATSGRVGDVNGDDAVNIIDAQQISRFTVGLAVANPILLQQRGDVNASGMTDVVDAQQIARFSVGLSAAPLINTLGTFIPMATAVGITPGTNQGLSPGGSIQLLATPTTAMGAVGLTGCAPVTWQSSNPGAVVVNASGFASAIGGGIATITATSGSGSGMVGFSVSGSSSAPVASVSVNVASPTITIGSTTQATATLRDATNNLITGRAITWASDNTSCATVNSTTGAVTGVAPCNANIIATAEGVSGQNGVSVVQAAVSTVSVSLANGSVTIGGTTQATATVRDVGSNVLTGRAVTWSSSNTARATVSSSGVVTGVSSGTVNIVATVETVTGQASMSVAMVPVASVTVALGQTSLSATTPIQTSTQATATLRDASGNILTDRTIMWSSSNTARATVNSSGLVTAVTPGTADIVATVEGVTGLRTITLVTPPVNTVNVSLGVAAIVPGSTTGATAVLRDDKTNVLTGRSVTFSSSNTSVASVGASSGTVTGVSNGTSNIVATSEGKTGQASITVAQSVSNEPSGLTAFRDRPFNCEKPTECESDWGFNGAFTVVQDATARRSADKVGQFRYAAGFTGGKEPGSAYPLGGAFTKRQYVSVWLKLSTNFQGHNSATNKLVHFFINGINRVFLFARGVGSGSLTPAIGLQQIAAPYTNSLGETGQFLNLLPNIAPTTRLTRGEWYHFEIVMVANTPGVADGRLTMWVGGTMVLDYSGIMFTPAGATSLWEGMNVSPTWGGVGDTVNETMYLWVDHFYASRGN